MTLTLLLCNAVLYVELLLLLQFESKNSPKEGNQSYECEVFKLLLKKSQYSGSEVTDLDDSHMLLPATLSRVMMHDDTSGSLTVCEPVECTSAS